MDREEGKEKRKRDSSPGPKDADEESSSSEKDDASVVSTTNSDECSEDRDSSSDEGCTGDQDGLSVKYEVEKIVQKRIRGHKWEYYVKWKGYPNDDNTWLVFYDLLDYRELITQFEERDDTIRKQHRSKILAPMSVILGGNKVKPHSAFDNVDGGQEPLDPVPKASSSKAKKSSKYGSSLSSKQSEKKKKKSKLTSSFPSRGCDKEGNETDHQDLCEPMKENVSTEVDKNQDGTSDTESIPDGYYEVEKIVAKMTYKGREIFLVKWLGYGPADTTWEPFDHIKDTEALEIFNDTYMLPQCLKKLQRWT